MSTITRHYLKEKSIAFKIDKTFLKLTNTLAIKIMCTERYLIVKRPIKLPELL